jgi:membrane protease YdiL (CAAX protease family)
MLISLLLSAILQVLIATGIAFVAYLVTRRKAAGFFAYVGLYRPERRSLAYATVLAAVFTTVMLLLFRVAHLGDLATAPNTVGGRLRALGPSGLAVVALIIYAVIQTSLSEEILFRGLLGKRLIAAFGFAVGNTVQAVLFGSMHLLIFAGSGASGFGLAPAAFIVGATGAVGWFMGAVNEKRGNGSIMPSWWTHALTNLTAYGVLAFSGR